MLLLTDPLARPVIAHRGNSAYAPENTVEAYDQAIALGADALEFDVRLTRDGTPVVIHDETLDRTTDARGLVRDRTLSELRDVDAGARFTRDGRSYPYRGRDLRILTLDEMLARYRSVPLLIEVKEPVAVEPTRVLLESARVIPHTLVDSTHHAAVAPFRGGALATGASLRDVVRLLARATLPYPPRTLPYQAICIPRWYNGVPVPVRLLTKAANRAAACTHVWTINDPIVARQLWSAGVNGIITDDTGAMVKLRRGMFPGLGQPVLPRRPTPVPPVLAVIL